MDEVVLKLYRHIFSGGTCEQLEKDNVTIVILTPKKGSGGVVTRRGGDPLYFKTIVFFNTLTGDSFLRTPGDWGVLDPGELQNKLGRLGL